MMMIDDDAYYWFIYLSHDDLSYKIYNSFNYMIELIWYIHHIILHIWCRPDPDDDADDDDDDHYSMCISTEHMDRPSLNPLIVYDGIY